MYKPSVKDTARKELALIHKQLAAAQKLCGPVPSKEQEKELSAMFQQMLASKDRPAHERITLVKCLMANFLHKQGWFRKLEMREEAD